MISANMPYTKSFKTINGKSIAFVDVGEGDPIVLLPVSYTHLRAHET